MRWCSNILGGNVDWLSYVWTISISRTCFKNESGCRLVSKSLELSIHWFLSGEFLVKSVSISSKHGEVHREENLNRVQKFSLFAGVSMQSMKLVLNRKRWANWLFAELTSELNAWRRYQINDVVRCVLLVARCATTEYIRSYRANFALFLPLWHGGI